MPASANHVPKYRHFKPKNLGVVRIDGKDFYLGKFGSPESYERYRRLLAERFSRPAASPSNRAAKPQSEVIMIVELAVGYYKHVESYYVKHGKPTHQVAIIKYALKTLNSLYGSTLCKDFGPLALKAVRGAFVEEGLSRNEVNRRVRLIKQMFNWAANEELIPKGVNHELQSVKGLLEGRTLAPDRPPVKPVPEAIVEQTLKHLSPTIAAMVRLEQLTGMRPGEVCGMRMCDISMSGPVWEYRPETFKTEHHSGSARVIPIGPLGQAIIKPFLGMKTTAHIFRPDPNDPRKWRSYYHVDSYRRAIWRACDKANPHAELSCIPSTKLTAEQKVELETWHKAHRWNPNQLRHSSLTAIRRKHGAEAAQTVAGHAQLNTTEIYAEKNLEAARAIMLEMG